MITQWRSFLLEKSAEWDLPKTGNWNFLLNNNYHPHCSNLNLLWFHNGDSYPSLVTKLFREPQLPQREFENLTNVYACAPTLVPRPLHYGPQGEFWSLWMKGVSGVRFRARMSYAPDTLASLVEMVASFHISVRKRGASPDRYRRLILEPIQTVMQFGSSSVVRNGCARVQDMCTADWINSVVVIPQHGDLFFSNVLSHKDQWSIVDWESYGTIDIPFYDVFTLMLSLLRAGGERPEQWTASVVRQVPTLIERYAERVGLLSANLNLLLPLTLLNWFHLQWSDGRKEFTESMYKTLQHYFEHVDAYETVFLPASKRSRGV